jgi:fructose-1,6-bisphosphatase/inositol monophosphatase family enzyme
MITAKEFQSKFISIIDQHIGKDTQAWKKYDGSLVTNIDLIIEEELYFLIKENFHDITIISEENVKTHKEEYILKNKFAIIDPIDGTENFNYLNNLYGCVISVVYDSFVYHGIYIPEQKNIISNLNIKDQITSLSNIILLSTSCLQNFDTNNNTLSNHRIFGSSSFMFFILFSGKANSYKYCKNCKIWDCFTGLSLAINSGFYDIVLNGVKITNMHDLIKVPHHSNFQITKK